MQTSCCREVPRRRAAVTSGLDFQQLKVTELQIQTWRADLQSERRATDSDVEAQQVADHRRHGGQDHHSGEVVDQRVDGQAQQPEGSIQLLGAGEGQEALTGSAVVARQRRPLTFISLVANFRTLLTTLSSSFLLGFFSILRNTLICKRRQVQARAKLRGYEKRRRLDGSHLLSEENRGVAVLAVDLGAQRRQP